MAEVQVVLAKGGSHVFITRLTGRGRGDLLNMFPYTPQHYAFIDAVSLRPLAPMSKGDSHKGAIHTQTYTQS
jgi:hypothetical protein